MSSQTRASVGAGTVRSRPDGRAPARSTKPGGRALLAALPWLAPALALIFVVVLFPIGVMFFNSTRDISKSGIDKGIAGSTGNKPDPGLLKNFQKVLGDADFVPILIRTLVWVVVVVALTVIISLALAQLLNKAFPGRKLVRMIVVIPWASSVVMTTMVVYYGLEPYFGIINKFLFDVGLIDDPVGIGWTKNPTSAFIWSIAVAIFVSLPFTTYTLLAGLQTVPGDIVEAARMDGANARQTYWQIILPQLKPALSVAVLINIINVFNNLPILRVMTGSLPGYGADTIMTRIFKYLDEQNQGAANALSVIAFLIVIVIVAIYVKIVKPMKEV